MSSSQLSLHLTDLQKYTYTWHGGLQVQSQMFIFQIKIHIDSEID